MLKHCKSCRQDLQESKYSNGRKTCDECLVKRKKKTKITLDMCKQIAESKGGSCESTGYKSTDTKMLWRCSENHKWESVFYSIKRGSWCPHCVGKAPLTLGECKQFAISKGGECLSTEYKNTNIPMLWRCSEGHEWKAAFGDVKRRTWCKKCVSISQRLSIEECHDYAKNKGGKCLSTEYTNLNTKLQWECDKGHRWDARFLHFKHRNGWCPYCACKVPLTLEECQQFAISKGGVCLSTEYKKSRVRMRWKCSESHEWMARFDDIKSGKSWCAACSGLSKHTIEECQEKAESMGGKCLSTKYKNAHSKLQWECDKGHRWEAGYNGLKSKGRWCPSCAGSRSERMCREIIEKYLLEPFPTKKPKWLEGLELDGYNEELNIAFEYNGKQHYEYMPHFHRNGEEDFESQKARDRKKYRICRERKINLIIIPYQYDHTTPDELDDFIYTELCKIC